MFEVCVLKYFSTNPQMCKFIPNLVVITYTSMVGFIEIPLLPSDKDP